MSTLFGLGIAAGFALTGAPVGLCVVAAALAATSHFLGTHRVRVRLHVSRGN